MLLAAMLPSLHACYEYAPLATSTVPVGETVALQINDQGRVGLAERFGPGLTEIVGRVVSQQPNEIALNVYQVSQVSGESSHWSGEMTHLDRSYIGSIKGRQVSASRTTVLAVGGAAVLYYLIVNRNLIGGFSGPTGDPASGPPPVSIRIPLRHLTFTRHIASTVEDFWK